MQLEKAIEGYLLDITPTYSEKTVRLYTQQLSVLLGFLGNVEINTITKSDLDRYLVFLKKDYKPNRFSGSEDPLSPSAIDNHWKCIRSFFGWCEENVGANRPDKQLKRPRFMLPEIRPFSQEEIRKLVYFSEWTNEITPGTKRTYRRKLTQASRDKSLVLLMLDTGLRVGEVSRLRIEDIDLQAGQVIVRPFGSGIKSRPRLVYLGKRTIKALWHYIAENDLKGEDFLFTDRIRTIQSIILRLGRRAGIDKCHPHRFRHTFAMEYLRNGGDPFTLQKLIGHTSLEMVMVIAPLFLVIDDVSFS